MVTSSHPKRPRDPNQLAEAIIDTATGQKPDRDSYARGRKENRIGARMNKNVDESSRQTAKMNRERLALPERPAILAEIEKKGGGYPYEDGAPPGAKAGKGSARSTDRNLRSGKSARKGNAKKAIQVEGPPQLAAFHWGVRSSHRPP